MAALCGTLRGMSKYGNVALSKTRRDDELPSDAAILLCAISGLHAESCLAMLAAAASPEASAANFAPMTLERGLGEGGVLRKVKRAGGGVYADVHEALREADNRIRVDVDRDDPSRMLAKRAALRLVHLTYFQTKAIFRFVGSEANADDDESIEYDPSVVPPPPVTQDVKPLVEGASAVAEVASSSAMPTPTPVAPVNVQQRASTPTPSTSQPAPSMLTSKPAPSAPSVAPSFVGPSVPVPAMRVPAAMRMLKTQVIDIVDDGDDNTNISSGNTSSSSSDDSVRIIKAPPAPYPSSSTARAQARFAGAYTASQQAQERLPGSSGNGDKPRVWQASSSMSPQGGRNNGADQKGKRSTSVICID